MEFFARCRTTRLARPGMSIDQYLVSVAAPYGSMYEPNLFGAYTACCAILFLVDFCRAKPLGFRDRFGYRVPGNGTQLFPSGFARFNRSLHLGLLEKSSFRAVGQTSSGAALFLALCARWPSPLAEVLRERFSDFYYGGLRDETALVRVLVLQDAWQEIPAPLGWAPEPPVLTLLSTGQLYS